MHVLGVNVLPVPVIFLVIGHFLLVMGGGGGDSDSDYNNSVIFSSWVLTY